MKRILACILIAVMLLGVFASCGSSDDEQTSATTKQSSSNNQNNNSQNEPENEENKEPSWTIENLPESSVGLEFELNDDGKSYTVTGIGTCTATDIVIGKYDNLPVTSIKADAFYDCKGFTSVTIGNSVTSIGEQAFRNCTGLTSITIPDSVTSIGSSAFRGCTGITNVTLGNGVRSIEDHMFDGCNRLTGLTIGNSVTSIDEYAFLNCEKLVNVTIPSSVTAIKAGSFYGCIGFTNITIPDSVTEIGTVAFYGCTGLENVIINGSDNTTYIGRSAFYECTNLKNITIPNSVIFVYGGGNLIMGYIDFSVPLHVNCPELTVNFLGTKAEWESLGAFGNEPPSYYTVQCLDGTILPTLACDINAFGRFTIPPNLRKVRFDWGNPAQNSDKCDLVCEIRLIKEKGNKNDYEILYTSHKIKAGDTLEVIILSRGLDVGEYDAIFSVTPYSLEGKPFKSFETDFKLRVI